jgi:ABC-type antimicrobial peptide transport system permease subunit
LRRTCPPTSFDLYGLVDKAVWPRRFVVVLLAAFSAFALILASLGIYSVISSAVTQRTQELGIRVTRGASARDLQVRVLLRTLRLVGLGMFIGITVCSLLSRR